MRPQNSATSGRATGRRFGITTFHGQATASPASSAQRKVVPTPVERVVMVLCRTSPRPSSFSRRDYQFGPGTASAQSGVLEYNDDGHLLTIAPTRSGKGSVRSSQTYCSMPAAAL